MSKEKIQEAARKALDSENIPDDFSGTLRIELVCSSGGVRDVWIEKRTHSLKKGDG